MRFFAVLVLSVCCLVGQTFGVLEKDTYPAGFDAYSVDGKECDPAKFIADTAELAVSDANPRIRKDWNDMSSTEREAFLDAVVSFSNNGLLDYICFHASDGPFNRFHSGTKSQLRFFPWHRVFLWAVENQLGVPLPYWSFEHASSTVFDASIFALDAFGQYGEDPKHCVNLQASKLKDYNVTNETFFPNNCVERQQSPGPVFSGNDVINCLSKTNEADFLLCMDPFHSGWHKYFGGFMISHGSPRDPLFWLYHTNLDRLWQKYLDGAAAASQSTALEVDSVDFPEAVFMFGEDLPGFPKITASQALNLASFGTSYGEPVNTPPPTAAVAEGVTAAMVTVPTEEAAQANAVSGESSSKKRHAFFMSPDELWAQGHQLRKRFTEQGDKNSSLPSLSQDAICAAQLQHWFTSPLVPAKVVLNWFVGNISNGPVLNFLLSTIEPSGDYDSILGNYSTSEIVDLALSKIEVNAFLDFYVNIPWWFETFAECTTLNGGTSVFTRLEVTNYHLGDLTAAYLDAILRNEKTRNNLQTHVKDYARSLEMSANNPDIETLNKAGADITADLLSLIGGVPLGVQQNPVSTSRKRASSPVAPPAAWTCPAKFYGTDDGCDCLCGAPDPDCPDQFKRMPFVGLEIPVSGCNGSSVACIAGKCVNGKAPPPEWKCNPSYYNATDGCDCNCGAYDPDCDKVYSLSFKTGFPYLFTIFGCPHGVDPKCGRNAKCDYRIDVPAEWKCPFNAYGTGDACDCGCGAWDPDCDAKTHKTPLKTTGCACSNMTCGDPNSKGICSGSCNGATVESRFIDEMQPSVFNFTEYLQLNPDLDSKIISTEQQALQHWISFGINDGRQGAILFDSLWYEQTYPDVPNIYGKGHMKSISHYIKYGIKEKRFGSPFAFEWSWRLFVSSVFNSTYYLAKYPELKSQNVVNELTARRHWIKTGIYEGKRGSAEFDPVYYIANNADIKKIFGDKGYLGGLIHYVDHGRAEKRRGSA